MREANFDFTSGVNTSILEVADLAKGTYFLQIQSKEGVQQLKFVKL